MATTSTMIIELPVLGSPPPIPTTGRRAGAARPEAQISRTAARVDTRSDAKTALQVAPQAEPRTERKARRDRRNHGERRRRARRHATPLVPGMRIGPWQIESELGSGGMATVYAVVHTRFGKRAALKLAHGGMADKLPPDAFLREARIANLIDHPSVTEVFATGTHDGRPYLTMERLAGRSLGARAADLAGGAMPRAEAIALLLELVDVLEHAHAHGVTHRDLKLDNVFLLDEPGAGGRRIKLLDWGMARHAGENDPLRGMIAGTLTYVAPEQVRGDDITPAADVYALAVMAYQLLLGQPPFASPSDLELLDKHLRATPPAPHTMWPAIPDALDATLVAMLAKQPADRPSLADFARALDAAKATEIEAAPVIAELEPQTETARHRISKLRAAVDAVALAPAQISDVLDRPAPLPWIASPRPRLWSAALGIALTLAGVLITAIA